MDKQEIPQQEKLDLFLLFLDKKKSIKDLKKSVGRGAVDRWFSKIVGDGMPSKNILYDQVADMVDIVIDMVSHVVSHNDYLEGVDLSDLDISMVPKDKRDSAIHEIEMVIGAGHGWVK